jgi:hypothetical protein
MSWAMELIWNKLPMEARPDNLITVETVSEENIFLDLCSPYIPIAPI